MKTGVVLGYQQVSDAGELKRHRVLGKLFVDSHAGIKQLHDLGLRPAEQGPGVPAGGFRGDHRLFEDNGPDLPGRELVGKCAAGYPTSDHDRIDGSS